MQVEFSSVECDHSPPFFFSLSQSTLLEEGREKKKPACRIDENTLHSQKGGPYPLFQNGGSVKFRKEASGELRRNREEAREKNLQS